MLKVAFWITEMAGGGGGGWGVAQAGLDLALSPAEFTGGGLITVWRTIGEAAIRIAGRGDWTGVEQAISSAIHRAVQVVARGAGGSIPRQAYLSISGRGRESGGSGRRRRWLRCSTGWTGLGTLAGGIHGGGLITAWRTIGEAAIRIAGRGDWTGVEQAISSAIHRAVQVVACSTSRGVPR